MVKCDSKHTQKLFRIAFRFGVLPIVRYMYEIMRVKYDYEMLCEFSGTLHSELTQISCINSAPCTTNSSNTSCRFEIMGSHSPYRGVCYNYLQYMKRYSKRTYSKGIDWYQISPRFSNEVVFDKYVEDWLHLLDMSEKRKIEKLATDSVTNAV